MALYEDMTNLSGIYGYENTLMQGLGAAGTGAFAGITQPMTSPTPCPPSTYWVNSERWIGGWYHINSCPHCGNPIWATPTMVAEAERANLPTPPPTVHRSCECKR